MTVKKTIKRAFFSLLQPGSMALLILLYFLGSIQIESLHSFSHQQEYAEVHSVENEADPCHIRVYHNAGEGCDHPSHVTGDSRCSFCDNQILNTHLAAEFIADSHFISFSAFWIAESSVSSEHFVSYERGRAPPLV